MAIRTALGGEMDRSWFNAMADTDEEASGRYQLMRAQSRADERQIHE